MHFFGNIWLLLIMDRTVGSTTDNVSAGLFLLSILLVRKTLKSVTHTVLQHFSCNGVYLEDLKHKSFKPTEIFCLMVFIQVH